MSSSLTQDVREEIKTVLKEEENKTDLQNLTVLSRVGMKVSSAVSSELDADATSASSTALIDLGLRLSQSTSHGALKEIILHNTSGYSILMAINDEYIVFSGIKKVYRIGYYLGYLRELVKRLNTIISGDKETQMAMTLEESQVEEKEVEEKEEIPEEPQAARPSVEKDKEALDGLLGFLDDWEKEGQEDFEELEAESPDNIVSIPKSVGMEVGKERSVGIPTPEKEVSEPEFKVYDDEVPPVPIEDYTPMEVEGEGETQTEPTTMPAEEYTEEAPSTPSAPNTEEAPEELPSLDELPEPDFEAQSPASEYDTEFILEEESESLDAILKDLGWDEE
jgi:predicted regulator of Ras-like GTPase activity (Roadblock/LC7/MglB family)